MTEAHNGHKWITHFVCQQTHYHWVWTYRDKGEATHIVTLRVNLTENQYEYRISFLRTDGEPSLGRVFTALLTQHGKLMSNARGRAMLLIIQQVLIFGCEVPALAPIL